MSRMALKEQIMEVIGGPHPTAVATLDGNLPAVRFMVLAGFPDMTLVGATMKSSKKVEQLKKNPDTALSIWSGKEFSDPYVEIKAKGKIHEDVATKKKSLEPDVRAVSSRRPRIRILSCSCSRQARSRTTEEHVEHGCLEALRRFQKKTSGNASKRRRPASLHVQSGTAYPLYRVV